MTEILLATAIALVAMLGAYTAREFAHLNSDRVDR